MNRQELELGNTVEKRGADKKIVLVKEQGLMNDFRNHLLGGRTSSVI
jgi:hypothetical protein